MKITGQGLLKATSVVIVVSAIAGASAWGLKNDLKPVQSTYGSTPVIEEVVETPIEAPAPVEQVAVVEETPSPKPEPKPEPVETLQESVKRRILAIAVSRGMENYADWGGTNPYFLEAQAICVDRNITRNGGYGNPELVEKYVQAYALSTPHENGQMVGYHDAACRVLYRVIPN